MTTEYDPADVEAMLDGFTAYVQARVFQSRRAEKRAWDRTYQAAGRLTLARYGDVDESPAGGFLEARPA